jgi:hypothetical protein
LVRAVAGFGDGQNPRLHRELNLNYASLGLIIDLLDRIASSNVATAPPGQRGEIDGLNRLTQKSQEALHDAQTKALRFGTPRWTGSICC